VVRRRILSLQVPATPHGQGTALFADHFPPCQIREKLSRCASHC
jgi:hypothetical protein